jgi:transcriptional regulator with XRE-family HTH domain
MKEYQDFLGKIGYTVRFHRVQRNLTQREVALSCNLGFRTFQRIENGEVFPRLDTLLTIAQFLKIPLSVANEMASPPQLGVLKTEANWQVQEERGMSRIQQHKQQLRPLAEAILKPHLEELKTPPSSELLFYRLRSNICELSPELQAHMKWPTETMELDKFVQGVRLVDVWEMTHRMQAKVVLTRHIYNLPERGTVLVLAVNFVVQSDPASPEAFGYLINITSAEELNKAFSLIHAG